MSIFSKRSGPYPETTPSVFPAELQRARASGRPLLDLATWEPARWGLGGDRRALDRALSDRRADAVAVEPLGLREAREGIALYLGGPGREVDPDRILITTSARDAYALIFRTLCQPGDEVLVPSPNHPLLDAVAASRSVQLVRYAVEYDGEWHLDRRSVRRAVTGATRAIVAASPANPTGAVLSRDELEFLEELCAAEGLALIGDEALANTALEPGPSVLGVSSCVAFHLSGLSTVCGISHVASWIAVSGPEALATPALRGLEAAARDHSDPPAAVKLAIPELLASREPFLTVLRQRLSGNRARLATAALREAPWTPLRTGGGWSAVLHLGGALEEEALCLELLQDGVALRPGFLDGFERYGYVVLSLLPDPATFGEALQRLERHLR